LASAEKEIAESRDCELNHYCRWS